MAKRGRTLTSNVRIGPETRVQTGLRTQSCHQRSSEIRFVLKLLSARLTAVFLLALSQSVVLVLSQSVVLVLSQSVVLVLVQVVVLVLQQRVNTVGIPRC
ncbi:hypothetical protein CesoFtcFv8_026435 [Champsocephalus esox]|uniref:Uncharacterized protein n=1 Tax=Champsocephalus esox TaxID=159716 RepID=A0AAN8GAH0_9TELE|nr:hypothetical protein CesoFtcFv8_026435 [Champsocephalus esox]